MKTSFEITQHQYDLLRNKAKDAGISTNKMLQKMIEKAGTMPFSSDYVRRRKFSVDIPEYHSNMLEKIATIVAFEKDGRIMKNKSKVVSHIIERLAHDHE